MGAIYLIGDRLIYIYMMLVVVTAFLSWVPMLYNSRIGTFLRKLTDPVEDLVRKFIPPIMGMDFSPLVVVIMCEILQWLWNTLFSILL